MKKNFIALFLSLILSVGATVPTWAAQANSANLTNETYSDVINDYMEQMDAIYVTAGATKYASIQDILIDSNESWQARISRWAEELEIVILSQESTYSIKSVIAQDDTQTKLLVYIWTTLEYENIDEHEESYIMGFGMDHILTLDNCNNSVAVVEDSFVDNLLNYSQGNPNDCALLLAECDNTGAEELPLDIGFEAQATAVYASYRPSAAVTYSDKWVGHTNVGSSVSMNPSTYNPEYYYYPNADCANFVSQCMLAGGMPQGGAWTVTKNTGSTVPVADNACAKSGIAWRAVSYFRNYWKGQGYSEIPVVSASKAAAGNPIFSDGHVMLIVDVDSKGRIIINGHNDDAYHYPLQPSSTYKTFELTHNYSYVYTDTTHTRVCSICNNALQTVAHTWRLIGGNFICSVCGYTTTRIPEISR
ncbi:MAG: amidase domain-containing protein [Oscillospiraceae bacterium]|nr:amidase domain-containing protein [Oscillospiraceae bacterium]